ncbi:FadR/GntR family transcriptional regulator [Streptomyces ipomoeae]|uniref:FadR/GntR family transcriptional regulator n=1 Tax=Streptomyces ipomoeae TaxID=103232 RepID=UPI00114693FD|nr:FadR/GntR family transcriptional regulator [Streptomyces ipomoeae]MDX2937781.1 FadR/GntR family transcriptional regulator [Streptomyces ipomoeae]TQE17214.1 FadR family transcriptional regulator [Streptomyces ipomoeae]
MAEDSSRGERVRAVPVVGRPQKQASLIAKHIMREIDTRGLREGDQLPPEREMLEMYSVGRGTLREALRVLELHGVLMFKPGRGGGPVITTPDSRHLASTLALMMQFSETRFSSVVEARQYLEPITAGLCAEKASDEILEAIRDSVDAMEANMDDSDAFLEENRRFHDLVAQGSGNPLFGYFISSLHWITDGTALGVGYAPKYRRITWRAHRQVYLAIESRDPERAQAAMLDHMTNSRIYFEKNYTEILDQRLGWELYGA